MILLPLDRVDARPASGPATGNLNTSRAGPGVTTTIAPRLSREVPQRGAARSVLTCSTRATRARRIRLRPVLTNAVHRFRVIKPTDGARAVEVGFRPEDRVDVEKQATSPRWTLGEAQRQAAPPPIPRLAQRCRRAVTCRCTVISTTRRSRRETRGRRLPSSARRTPSTAAPSRAACSLASHDRVAVFGHARRDRGLATRGVSDLSFRAVNVGAGARLQPSPCV